MDRIYWQEPSNLDANIPYIETLRFRIATTEPRGGTIIGIGITDVTYPANVPELVRREAKSFVQRNLSAMFLGREYVAD